MGELRTALENSRRRLPGGRLETEALLQQTDPEPVPAQQSASCFSSLRKRIVQNCVEKKDCSKCGGTGRVPDHTLRGCKDWCIETTKECPTCDGTGKHGNVLTPFGM